MDIQAIGSGAGLAELSAGTRKQIAPASAPDLSYDVRDTNKDGYVSYLEAIIYSLEHPGEQAADPAANTLYNEKGHVNNVPAATQGLIDITI